jgi:hypothetical protein
VPQQVLLAVSFESKRVREYNSTEVVFGAENHRVETYFPWEYVACFFLTKEFLEKHLD